MIYSISVIDIVKGFPLQFFNLVNVGVLGKGLHTLYMYVSVCLAFLVATCPICTVWPKRNTVFCISFIKFFYELIIYNFILYCMRFVMVFKATICALILCFFFCSFNLKCNFLNLSKMYVCICLLLCMYILTTMGEHITNKFVFIMAALQFVD